jgi:hypothetical protein
VIDFSKRLGIHPGIVVGRLQKDCLIEQSQMNELKTTFSIDDLEKQMVQNMTEIAEKLKVELSQLSIKDRAELAYFLIHSLEESKDDDVEVAWDRELTGRLDEILSGKAIGESSNQVFSKLREKYS